MDAAIRGVKPWHDGGRRLADSLIEKSMTAERALLTAGWFNWVALEDFAARDGLRGDHFARPSHSMLFAYLCSCAANGTAPTAPRYIRVAASAGLEADVLWLRDEIDALGELLLDPGFPGNMLPMLVAAVLDFADMRDEARTLLARLAKLGVKLADAGALLNEPEPPRVRVIRTPRRKRGRAR